MRTATPAKNLIDHRRPPPLLAGRNNSRRREPGYIPDRLMPWKGPRRYPVASLPAADSGRVQGRPGASGCVTGDPRASSGGREARRRRSRLSAVVFSGLFSRERACAFSHPSSNRESQGGAGGGGVAGIALNKPAAGSICVLSRRRGRLRSLSRGEGSKLFLPAGGVRFRGTAGYTRFLVPWNTPGVPGRSADSLLLLDLKNRFTDRRRTEAASSGRLTCDPATFADWRSPGI